MNPEQEESTLQPNPESIFERVLRSPSDPQVSPTFNLGHMLDEMLRRIEQRAAIGCRPFRTRDGNRQIGF